MLTEILPQSLHDEKILALCAALDAELEKVEGELNLVQHLPRLEDLPGEVLDHLAWQYHVDFYSDKFTLQMKRDLIRQSFFVHRIKGTPAAVEKFLSSVMSGVEVTEWFDYGGKPYFFKITTAGLKLELDDDDEFKRLIDSSKNLRSWLESIIFDLTITEPETYYVSAVNQRSGKVTVDSVKNFSDKATHFLAGNILSSGRSVTDFSRYAEPDAQIFSAMLELQAGKVIVDCQLERDVTYDFYRICKWRWRRWKVNPVVQYYYHHEHAWDDWTPDDDDDPIDTNFLRLYLKFEAGSRRSLKIYNPREDIQAQEFYDFSDYIAAHGILLNKEGYHFKYITKAVYLSKTVETV